MKKIIIKGKVQGVFFRKFVYDNASSLDLKGYVKNLNNGDVEVVAKGSEENIKKLIELCRKGPSGASVYDVIVNNIENEEFENFEIRY